MFDRLRAHKSVSERLTRLCKAAAYGAANTKYNIKRAGLIHSFMRAIRATRVYKSQPFQPFQKRWSMTQQASPENPVKDQVTLTHFGWMSSASLQSVGDLYSVTGLMAFWNRAFAGWAAKWNSGRGNEVARMAPHYLVTFLVAGGKGAGGAAVASPVYTGWRIPPSPVIKICTFRQIRNSSPTAQPL